MSTLCEADVGRMASFTSAAFPWLLLDPGSEPKHYSSDPLPGQSRGGFVSPFFTKVTFSPRGKA